MWPSASVPYFSSLVLLLFFGDCETVNSQTWKIRSSKCWMIRPMASWLNALAERQNVLEVPRPIQTR